MHGKEMTVDFLKKKPTYLILASDNLHCSYNDEVEFIKLTNDTTVIHHPSDSSDLNKSSLRGNILNTTAKYTG